MPVYEYLCECGCEREAMLSIEDRNKMQICECGEVMGLKISLPMSTLNTRLRFTKEGKAALGQEMALGSLNSKYGGMPDTSTSTCDLKPMAQQKAAAGLEKYRSKYG